MYSNPTINFKDETLWLQRNISHVLTNVVEGSFHVSEGFNLPYVSDSKNTFPYFFIQPLTGCTFDHNTEVSYHWSKTYQANQSFWNMFCLIRFPKRFSKFPSNNEYNFGIDFSSWTDLKKFFQWMDCSGQPVLTNDKFP